VPECGLLGVLDQRPVLLEELDAVLVAPQGQRVAPPLVLQALLVARLPGALPVEPLLARQAQALPGLLVP
jgi:hypothetical protein